MPWRTAHLKRSLVQRLVIVALITVITHNPLAAHSGTWIVTVKQGNCRSKATKLVIKELIISLVEGAAYALSLIEQRVSIIKQVTYIVYLI
jgi:hypothetical protein